MKQILVIRLGAIGDVILASAPLLNLKLAYPESEISFLTRHDLAGLAEYMTGADKILPFPQHAGNRDLVRMGEYLDAIGFDAVVDLHGNLRSWYLRRYINANRKIVYPKRRLDRIAAVRLNRIDPNPPHTINLYNTAVESVGAKIHADRPVLNLIRRPKRFLEFDNNRSTIGLAPGASYPTKQYPPAQFASVVDSLYRETDYNLAVFLSSDDREFEEIKEGRSEGRFSVFYDVPLESLAYLIEECRLLLCNDSGLMHLGSAVGTPVLALFGPTHPTLGFSPRGLFDEIIRHDVYCSPCSLHGKRKCFREKQFCFTEVRPDMVFERIQKSLEENRGGEKALFIDRDGTLIKEKNFLSEPDQVDNIAGAIEGLKLARNAGFKIIVVSNQSGVARGKFDESSVRAVNQRVLDIFRENGVIIDDILYCPYFEGGEIEAYNKADRCRKPSPGMIEKASKKHQINPFESYVIGDKLSDIFLAHVTGAKGILVRTGYGDKSEGQIGTRTPRPENIVDNIYEAVKYITEKGK